MKTPITLSINPSYYCNFSCNFCYLTPEQLNNVQLLPLGTLSKQLDAVSERYQITHVDLYGGEVLLLPDFYLQGLKTLLVNKGIESVSLITNLSFIKDVVYDPYFQLTVSFDSIAREKSEVVFNNLLMLERDCAVLTLVSKELIEKVSPDDLVNTLNLLNNVVCVELKPYSTNQANAANVTFTEFEDYVWAVMTHPGRNFDLQNEVNIDESLAKTRNAYSDDHLYITPTGNFAVLEFDLNDNEYFLPVTLDAYKDWCIKERLRGEVNKFCNVCKFKGHCLTEHLRDVKSLDNSCNGFRNLLIKSEEYVCTT